MKESLRAYSERMGFCWLSDEFDTERNAPLTAETVRYGSRKEVWWRCGQGHTWRMSPSARRGGSRCPYCTGARAESGRNDLAALYPEVARQWHPTKNGELRPETLLPGSRRVVWWQCGEGHSWTDSPFSRVHGKGCPECEAKKSFRPLAETEPTIAASWHPTKNGALTARDVSADSARRVWWQCEKGHAYQASAAARVLGAACPFCAGRKLMPGVNDLETLYPKLAAEWAEENGARKPSEIAASSARRVWWRCGAGHAFRAAVDARVKGGAPCPYCAGRLTEKREIPKPPRAAIPYPGERPAV